MRKMPKTKKPQGWIVIGIGGVTCGGKTTLSSQVHSHIHPSYVMHQDAFFYPDDHPNHVKCEGMDHNNYDIMSSLDMNRMYDDVLSVMKGKDTYELPVQVSDPTSKVQQFVYLQAHKFFAKGPPSSRPMVLTPYGEWYTLPNKKILIVEGFSILNYKPIADLCDYKYFMTLEFGDCMARRVYRTYVPPDVPGYFEQYVWPNYLLCKDELESDSSVCYLDGMVPGHGDLILDNLKKIGLVPMKGK